jgi:hypothetical protein
MNEHEAQLSHLRPWIEIQDEEITSEELVAEIERRVARRRAQLGTPNLVMPTFGHVSTYPEPPPGTAYDPNLYYYLKQANEAPQALVEPILVSSPATRVPVLGRLWRMIRRQMHELVLFYVNRSVSDQNQLNINLISILNELTRVSQAQQIELDALRAELQRLKGRTNPGEGK